MSSYSFLVGPLIAFGALGVILLLCRWVFSTSDRDRRTAQRAARPGDAGADYGLLVPVAAVRTSDDAEMLRSLLREAGIRCTVVERDGGAEVLVFAADADRARDLVSSS